MKNLYTLLIVIILAAIPASVAHAGTLSAPPFNDLGLIGYWTMDGNTINWGTEKMTDQSGSGNTAVLVNLSTTTSPSEGIMGQSLSFNGSNQYLDISPVPAASNPFTVTAWVNPSALSQSSYGGGTGGTIIDENEDGGSVGWDLGIKNTNKIWFWPSNGNDKFSTNSISLNVWTHVAITYDGTDLNIYLNGVLDSTQAMSIPQSSASIFKIGAESWITGFWKGGLDDVRLYNRALSTAEISNMYSATKATVDISGVNLSSNLLNGLISWWPFDGKYINWTTNTASDASGNGHTANIVSLSTSTAPTLGYYGQALHFTGVSTQTVTVPSVASLAVTQFTLDTLVKFDANNLNLFFLQRGTSGNTDNFYLWYEPSNSYCTNSVASGDTLIGGFENTASSYTNICYHLVPTLGKWYHLSLTYDQSHLYLYVNGSQVASLVETATPITSGTMPFYIGNASSNTFGNVAMDGSIDDVRIYNRALSLSEISQLYNAQSAIFDVSRSPDTLNDGLLLWLPFDGKDMNWTTDTTTDASGNGDTGIISYVSTTTSPTPGVIGQGLTLDGSSQYVTTSTNFGSATSLENFSVSVWFKTTSASGHPLIGLENTQSGTGSSINDHTLYVSTSGTLIGYIYDTAGEYVNSSPKTVTDGKWHLGTLTATANGNLTLYLDGAQVGQSAIGVPLHTYSTSYWRIGSYKSASSQGADGYFPGSIDDVRVYNRALTAVEVQELYSFGHP